MTLSEKLKAAKPLSDPVVIDCEIGSNENGIFLIASQSALTPFIGKRVKVTVEEVEQT